MPRFAETVGIQFRVTIAFAFTATCASTIAIVAKVTTNAAGIASAAAAAADGTTVPLTAKTFVENASVEARFP